MVLSWFRPSLTFEFGLDHGKWRLNLVYITLSRALSFRFILPVILSNMFVGTGAPTDQEYHHCQCRYLLPRCHRDTSKTHRTSSSLRPNIDFSVRSDYIVIVAVIIGGVWCIRNGYASAWKSRNPWSGASRWSKKDDNGFEAGEARILGLLSLIYLWISITWRVSGIWVFLSSFRHNTA
jgi:hypothetical protein